MTKKLVLSKQQEDELVFLMLKLILPDLRKLVHSANKEASK